MLQRGLHTVQFCTAGLNGVDRVRVYRVDIFILYLGGGASQWRQDHSNETQLYDAILEWEQASPNTKILVSWTSPPSLVSLASRQALTSRPSFFLCPLTLITLFSTLKLSQGKTLFILPFQFLDDDYDNDYDNDYYYNNTLGKLVMVMYVSGFWSCR